MMVFTSHGPTVIMPSWCCARDWFDQVGWFNEGGKGVPEDLLFFYESLRKGGGVSRVDECLLMYRYHSQAATHSVLEDTIWYHRVMFLEERILSRWASFTIWNAGKQGRKLYRSLTPANQKKTAKKCVALLEGLGHPLPFGLLDILKMFALLSSFLLLVSKYPPFAIADAQVVAFCDVDENKIRKGFYTHEESKERPKPKIPVKHFKEATPPYIICVKLCILHLTVLLSFGHSDLTPNLVDYCFTSTHAKCKDLRGLHPHGSLRTTFPIILLLTYVTDGFTSEHEDDGKCSSDRSMQDLTGGGLEENLCSLNLKEGQDYFHFS
ncbi:UNVERIFIED_CONTAM: hypothetical protein FKN15_068725 [Acipenser sinensis]